ncbi:MAG: GNAT family N-acetyltransferase [Lachnospiraceae bacterium]|nr:GNAT family N-acetyltransferase [Lachnospiraceae bacterium]
MKISMLREEYYDFFAELDPFFFLERAQLPGYLCLGAVMEGEPFDKPAALMVLRASEDALIVEWLFVKGEYRMQAVGRDMMGHAFRLAREGGLEKLCLYVNKEYGRSEVCLFEKSFLDEYNFTLEQKLGGEWLTDVESILALPGYEDAEDILPETQPLGSLKSTERSAFLQEMAKNDKAVMLFPSDDSDIGFDPELSRISHSGGKITGAILYLDIQSSLYVCGMLARNKTELQALVWSSVSAAAKKYGADKQLRIICYTEQYKQQLKDLLPDEAVQNELFTASVEEYFATLSEVKALKEDMPVISEVILPGKVT